MGNLSNALDLQGGFASRQSNWEDLRHESKVCMVSILAAAEMLRRQQADSKFIKQLIDGICKLEKVINAMDCGPVSQGDTAEVDVELDTLLNDTLDLLGDLMSRSGVIAVVHPCDEVMCVRTRPNIACLAMADLVEYCIKCLEPFGGGFLDFKISVHGSMVNLAVEIVCSPDWRTIPERLYRIARILRSVKGHLRISEEKGRSYIVVSLPFSNNLGG